MYYRCHEKRHEFEVAFTVIHFKPVSPKMCVLRTKQQFFNISLIVIHALIANKAEDKDTFYYNLKKAYDECPKQSIKIKIEAFNS